MNKSSQGKETGKIWTGQRSRRLPEDIQQLARRKLRMLNNAHSLDDLRIPPTNQQSIGALEGRPVAAAFEPTAARQVEPLMGWTSSADTQAQLRLQRINAELVQTNRDLVDKEYTAGQASLVRLNEAQRDLVTAQSRLALALATMRQAWFNLETVTGHILEVLADTHK